MTWTRARRRELKRQVEIAADIADRRLKEAIERGWIDPTDLPADVAQRLQEARQPFLEGRVEGGTIVVIESPAPRRRK
jgi:hypothetical protein